MHRTRSLLASAAALGLVLATPSLATAAGTAKPKQILRSSAAASAFNLDVNGKHVLVADAFLGQVGALQSNGTITPVAKGDGASGVARSGRYLAYTTTTSTKDFVNTASGLTIVGPHRTVKADTLAYEKAKNPDRVNTYGVVKYPARASHKDKACVNAVFSQMTGGQATYKGMVDSHAYSVAAYGDSWLVADAGANAILKVNSRGKVSTLSVLPPQTITVTKAQAAALDLPKCVVGVKYAFEPVPTDIEVARDGSLYATTLPGGPEDASLGARGALWRIDARSGKAHKIASGFLGATNLAIGRSGEIYVAELFAGKISVVRRGHVSTFAKLAGAAAVEVSPSGSLWAGTVSLTGDPGTIVEFKGGHSVKRWHRR